MNECVTTRGKLVIHTLVLLSPSSIIWYQQKLGHKLVYTTTGVNLAAKNWEGPSQGIWDWGTTPRTVKGRGHGRGLD